MFWDIVRGRYVEDVFAGTWVATLVDGSTQSAGFALAAEKTWTSGNAGQAGFQEIKLLHLDGTVISHEMFGSPLVVYIWNGTHYASSTPNTPTLMPPYAKPLGLSYQVDNTMSQGVQVDSLATLANTGAPTVSDGVYTTPVTFTMTNLRVITAKRHSVSMISPRCSALYSHM